MTVDGSDDRPLALRDLADADSPELVRSALGRFRRRLFLRGFIIALIVAVGFFLYPRYFHTEGDVAAEIRHGRGVDLYNNLKSGNIQATVFRVARLSGEVLAPDQPVERFGIHLIVTQIAPNPNERIVSLLRSDPDHGVLSYSAESSGNIADGIDLWMSLVAGTRAIDIPLAQITVDGGTTRRAPSISTLHIDMQKLGVPDWTWR